MVAPIEAFRIETTHRNEGFTMDFTTVCQSMASPSWTPICRPSGGTATPSEGIE